MFSEHTTRSSTHLWLMIGAGALLVAVSLWWAASSNQEREAKAIASEMASDATRPAPNGHVPRLTPIPAPVTAAGRTQVNASVQVTPVAPRAHASGKPCPHRVAKRPGSLFHDMFPVGNVIANPSRVVHPYRWMPELFPSFAYQGRVWMHTGGIARADQISLAQIGPELGGRKLYALANTSAPSTVLFVQSAQDPAKFAIYK